tara:strand:+ start:2117 stop:2404 length:288 start_codon:yes stop_codon:yes gene_type:complete
MNIEKMTYNEAKWWILNDWEFIEVKGSEHFKKEVMLLYCEGTKNIFFADKKTEEPIHTILYCDRNKKPKEHNKTNSLNRLIKAINKRDENRKQIN